MDEAAPGDPALLERFFRAFSEGDGDGMAACYHPDARFSDPVFRDLRGEEVGAMWRMLTRRSEDLEVRSSDLWAEGDRGGANWTAVYTFSPTRRVVRNEVTSRFRFEDGSIVEQEDTFDLWRWTRMALGVPGFLAGWTPLLRRRLRLEAREALDAFLAREEPSSDRP